MLPWVLLRDATPERQPDLFREESFVSVFAETAVTADSPERFVDSVGDFVNQTCWGTLAAGIMVPKSVRRNPEEAARVERLIDRLEYGTVSLNHWPGLAFGMMSCPWGGSPGSSLQDPRSGRNDVCL